MSMHIMYGEYRPGDVRVNLTGQYPVYDMNAVWERHLAQVFPLVCLFDATTPPVRLIKVPELGDILQSGSTTIVTITDRKEPMPEYIAHITVISKDVVGSAYQEHAYYVHTYDDIRPEHRVKVAMLDAVDVNTPNGYAVLASVGTRHPHINGPKAVHGATNYYCIYTYEFMSTDAPTT